MNTNLDNLKSKFNPYLLGHHSCTAPKALKGEIDDIFQKPLNSLKNDYIFDAGDWILKLPRTDGLLTTPDTHLYRVRKAEKIGTYLYNHNLENDLVVPKKYVYWHGGEKQFYTVSKKIDLSQEVASPKDTAIELAFKSCRGLGGQAEALDIGNSMRDLTPTQAKALAELSILGYTDLTYNNLFFTLDGKVAIIDTEPQKRGLKKNLANHKFAYWMGDKTSLLAQQSIAGIAKLKLCCKDPLALKEVERIERNHTLWNLAKLVGKIAITVLITAYIPTALALLPIGATAITALKILLVATTVLKTIFLTLNVLSIYFLWSLSHSGLQGVLQIQGLENQGII